MADGTPCILSVRGLRKSFGDTEVLRGITVDVDVGTVVAVIGASGSGKSTLLRCLNYLEAPTGGEVWVDGVPMGFHLGRDGRREPDSARDLARKRAALGMVFQQFNLWPHMTALQNVIEAPLRVKGLARQEAIALGRDLLAKVNLAEKADEYPARLSGGQQQRVAIARALAMQPKVMLFDEATSALDPELTGEVLDVMRALARDGTTMIVVTHEIGFARDVADRVLFLSEGRVEEDGPPGAVLGSPRSEACRRFLVRVLH
ncbi:amino acid ABC transporter ATP-binding protein [Elioraea sp.]|uniref:amino acid ABC transporter ATP-binding protein n=1 Tax=Elioraea sp. TaxID=2185103 RepID=UPI003F6FF378